MRTQRMLLVVLAALLGAGVCITSSSTFAQYGDKKDDHKGHAGDKPGAGMAGGAPQMTPEQQKEMEAWMKAGTPGEQHKWMADNLAGKWDAEVTHWMAPGAPPMTSTGSAHNQMILNGRYMHMMFKGDMMGQPFEGAGTWGYDNAAKKWVGTWMDSMSTCTMVMTGTKGSAPNTFESSGDMVNPMDGKTITMREVLTVTDKDHHMLEMYMPGPDGKEMKCMQIKYSRAK